MTAFAELDIAARTDQLVKAKRDLDALTGAATKAEGATERLDASTERLSASARQSSLSMQQLVRSSQGGAGGLQNVGFQVQDFAVQVAAGTSASQALAQQLPQLLSGFGLLGIGLGTASAVLIPLAGYFLGAAQGAQELRNAIDALDDQVSELNDLVGNLTVENYDAMIERYGVLNQAVYDNIATMTALNAQLITLTQLDLEGLFSEAFGGIFMTRVDEMRTAFETTNDQARQLLVLMDNVAQSRGPDELIKSMTVLRDQLIATAGGIDNLTIEQAQFVLEIGNAIDRANVARGALQSMVAPAERVNVVAMQLAPILQSAKDAASQAADAVAGIGSAAEGAVGAVSNLAAKMWDMAQARIAANNALETLAFENSPAGQALGRYGGRGTTSNRPVTMGTGEIVNFAGSGGGGSGGGGAGAADPFEARLDALMVSLQTERETLDAWYEESQAILADRRALEILGEEEHRLALIGVEEEYQARMAEIRAQASQAEISVRQQTVSMAIGLLQQLGERSKALAAIAVLVNAAQRIAEIRANTAAAVMRAYAELGPIAGSAAAVRIKAMGAVQTGIAMASAALQLGGGSAGGGSASIGGVSGASTGGGSRAPTAAPEQAQNRFLRIEVNGEGMFAEALRDNVQSIADAIADLGGRGGTTIVVGR